MTPGQDVRLQKIIELPGAVDRRLRPGPAVGDGAVTRCIESDDLLQIDPIAGHEVESDFLTGAALLEHGLPPNCACLPVDGDADPGDLRNRESRLHRLRLEEDGLGIRCVYVAHTQVRAIERTIARYAAAIHDLAVQEQTNDKPCRPILGENSDVLASQVLFLHVNKPALDNPRFSTLAVPDSHVALVEATAQIERLAIGQDLDPTQVEPVAVADAEGNGQPVRKVDQVLML